MSFDRFILAVESLDLPQTVTILVVGSLVKLSSLVNKLYFWKLLFTQARTFCKMNPLNPLRFTSHQRNWDKCLLFQIYKTSIFLMVKFTVIPKKSIWHLAICQNGCFGQFHHSKEKVNIYLLDTYQYLVPKCRLFSYCSIKLYSRWKNYN